MPMNLNDLYYELSRQIPGLTTSEFANVWNQLGSPQFDDYTKIAPHLTRVMSEATGRPANTSVVPVGSAASTGANAASSTAGAAGASTKAAGGAASKFKQVPAWLKNNVSYSWRSTPTAGAGLTIAGHNIGKYVPYAVGGVNVVQALSDVNDMSQTGRDMSDMSNDALIASLSNPMAMYDLSPSEQRTLRQIRNGSYNRNSFGDAFDNPMNILTNAAKGAVYGAAGGLPGAIVGGITGAVRGGTQNVKDVQNRRYGQLQGLYNNLSRSSQELNNMRRQRAYSRYTDTF